MAAFNLFAFLLIALVACAAAQPGEGNDGGGNNGGGGLTGAGRNRRNREGGEGDEGDEVEVGDDADDAEGPDGYYFDYGDYNPNQEVNSDSDEPLTRPPVVAVETLPHLCDCVEESTFTADIRDISDEFCADGNDIGNSFGFSNYIWAFGQFLDHELVALIEDEEGPTFTVDIDDLRTMLLHKVTADDNPVCPAAQNVHTGTIDGSVVYSANEEYSLTLRDDGTCYLREGEPGFLPLTTSANADGNFLVVAGDGRVDEHAVLTVMHTLFLREHNRQCNIINNLDEFADATEETKFQMAKAVIAAKLQQIVLTEFLPAFGITQDELEAAAGVDLSFDDSDVVETDLDDSDPEGEGEGMGNNNNKRRLQEATAPSAALEAVGSRVSAEFSTAYRIGHTYVPNTLGDLNVADLFDGNAIFLTEENGGIGYIDNAEELMTTLLSDLASQESTEGDGLLSDTLRDILFGEEFQEDLCSRNIFRSREMQIAQYPLVAECFGITVDESVPTDDLFLGLLWETKEDDEPLGPTHKAIFVDQFSRSIFGSSGLYWRTDPTMVELTAHAFEEILFSTLGNIIEENFDLEVQDNVFFAEESADTVSGVGGSAVSSAVAVAMAFMTAYALL